MTRSDKIPLAFLFIVVLLKAGAVLAVILFAGIGLGPDEAQYWTWSQKLSFGYYSKPPGIAWQIWFGTKLFGNTELGVRFGSLVIGSLLPFAVYFTALRANLSSIAALLAGLMMALTPIGFLSTFFAITDVGQVLFWILAFIPLIDAIQNKAAPNYPMLGLLIAFGALFKWQIYLIWVIVICLMAIYPFFRQKNLVGGILISLLGLLPSLVWNSYHDFPTFRHVFSTLKGAEEHAGNANVLDFIGAQAALVSPIIFILLIISFFHLSKASSELKFLGYTTLVILLVHVLYACFKKVQGNWCDYIYPAAFIYIAWACRERIRYGTKWLIVGLILSLLAVAINFFIPIGQREGKFVPASFKFNPFRHNLGWNNLAALLQKVGYDETKDFLFADSYQMTSLLSFYGPSQKRAYFFNLNHIRKNQFSYWEGMDVEQLGKTGFFAIAENGPNAEKVLKEKAEKYLELLKPYFKRVEIITIDPILFSYGRPVKSALVIRADGYNGLSPNDPLRY